MKYLTFASPKEIHNPCLGVLVGETIVDLTELRTWAQGARFIPSQNLPESLIGLLFAGSATWEYAEQLVAALEGEDPLRLKGAHRKPVGHPMREIFLYPPLPNPESLREFCAFEVHTKTMYAFQGIEIPPEWYQFPVFYFSNPHAMYGPGSVIPYPPNSEALD